MKHQNNHLNRSAAHAFCTALCLVTLSLAAFQPARADVVEAWAQSFNSGPGISLDRVVGVVVDHLGNVIVTGQLDDVDRITDSQSDFYTAKYAAADGHLLWQRRYNKAPDSYDYPTAVAVDRRGNVVVSGHSGNAYTAKYAAADGAVLWEQFVWDGSVQIEAMVVDGRDNVTVAGNSYVAKYAGADGTLLWEQQYAVAPTAVAVDARGNVAVTGNRESQEFNSDYYTAKFAAKDGSLIWEHSYNDPGDGRDYAAAIAVDDSGDVVVTGDSENADATTNYKSDYYTAKYAAKDGALIWEQRYNGPENHNDYGRAVAVDSSGNVIVTGDSIFSGAYPHFYTAKYAAKDGALLWGKYYTGVDNHGGDVGAVAVNRWGNVFVTGTSGLIVGEFYTAKYAGLDGALRWEKSFSGAGAWKQIRLSKQCLALGPGGMVAVAGTTAFEYNGDFDFATVVYRPEKSSEDSPVKKKNDKGKATK